MPNLVVHDAALAAKREALAAAQSAAMVRPAGGYGAMALSKPDPNAPAQRAERVRRLQFMVREREEERRRQRGEKVKPFSRKKNYYDRLGLPRDCSAAEVRRAFRRLSLLFHPDKQLGKSDEEVAAASVLFRELCEAHECLADEPTRREYDQMLAAKELLPRRDVPLDDLEAAYRAAQPPRRRAPPVYIEVLLGLAELHRGTEATVRHVRRDAARRSVELALLLQLPAGTPSGAELVFERLGDAGGGGEAGAGDVVCVVREAEDALFSRQGDDLVHVSRRQALPHELLLLLEVPTLEGGTRLAVGSTLLPRLVRGCEQGQLRLPRLGLATSAGLPTRAVGGEPCDGVATARLRREVGEAEEEAVAVSEDGTALAARGDLILIFGARAASAAAGRLHILTGLPAPPLLLLGPRPRPAPSPHSAVGQARLGALARAIVPPLATRVLPAAAARLLALSSSFSSCGRGAPPPPGLTPPPGQPPTGHLLWVRLGGAGFGAAEAAIAARGARAGAGGASGRRIDASRGALSGCSAATDAACVALCLALAPGLRCATLWLPTDAAAPDSEEEGEECAEAFCGRPGCRTYPHEHVAWGQKPGAGWAT
mmetsp:Transcript_9601/g.30920  ORF Transcript_9601/g.30920 Transcript_9601/m.30920 type:complete len:599 (-) Transcript_9601:245-2041(-)